ncbi:MAG: hypothetical protein JXQ96_19000 [Cyclobacteriaceae bacterium]
MIKKRLISTLLALVVFGMNAVAQCAMCKTTVVNNVSHGELKLAEGLNFGILYLFFTPYLAIAAIAFFWYRTSKANANKKQYKRYSQL